MFQDPHWLGSQGTTVKQLADVDARGRMGAQLADEDLKRNGRQLADLTSWRFMCIDVDGCLLQHLTTVTCGKSGEGVCAEVGGYWPVVQEPH